ncbi:MAG TPA: hypothetical protein VF625_18810 [Longimicrobium sp.]|jgi:hypothetical protein
MKGQSQPQRVFPILPAGLARALEEEPVLIDGQAVTFDQKVTLVPAELRPRRNDGGAGRVR